MTTILLSCAPFVPVSVTLVIFQGDQQHCTKMKLKIVFSFEFSLVHSFIDPVGL